MYEFIANNVPFFLFIILLSVFLFVKRKNLGIQGKFPYVYMALYRTKMGLDKMDKWSKKHPKTFLYLAYFSVFIGVVGIVLVFVMMFWQLNFIVVNNLETGGALVLPINTESGNVGGIPVVAPPFFEWLIALSVLIIVHEFAHGVIAKRFGVPIKSSGLAFFGSFFIGLLIVVLNFSFDSLINLELDFFITMFIGILFMFIPIIPGAFVEPDEKKLMKISWWKRVAVLGAGSTSNFIFGILFFGLWFGNGMLINSTMDVGDITFSGVMNESSLNSYNITSGKIIGINEIYENSLILKEFSKLKPNENINITINSSFGLSTYNVKTFENSLNSKKGMIGIIGVDTNLINKNGYVFFGELLLFFESLLRWTWLLNIMIGIMNLLPLWITDGGQITRTLLERKFNQKRTNQIYNFISMVSLLLIIFTVWPTLLFKFLLFF